MKTTAPPLPLQAQSVLELRRRRKKGIYKERHKSPFKPFGVWLKEARVDFRFDYLHFVKLQEYLDLITQGELKRVVFQVAIRHGKTEHNTISYIAYRIHQDPTCRVLLVSYNQKQALKFSRQIRRLCKSLGVQISPERDSASEWETTEGGGVRAVGMGEGIASINADLINIDDPIGKREDAESEAQRESIWDAFSNDILARTEPNTAVMLTCSRWHIDDLLGRVEDRFGDRWLLVDMQGVCEYEEDDEFYDVLEREEGDLLWPELRDQEWMDEKMVELGSYGFASQIQLRPRPREGGIFKWDWWHILKEVPHCKRMIRYWDLAGTDLKAKKGHDPDFTCGALLGRMPDDRTAIVDIERFRMSVARRDARMLEVCEDDLRKYYGKIHWWIETETGIQGSERTDKLVRRLQNKGMKVSTEHPTGSKLSRAEPLESAAEAGNIWLVEAPWNDSFRLEASNFTGKGGVHDDQIDGASGAYAKLSKKIGRVKFGTARM